MLKEKGELPCPSLGGVGVGEGAGGSSGQRKNPEIAEYSGQAQFEILRGTNKAHQVDLSPHD